MNGILWGREPEPVVYFCTWLCHILLEMLSWQLDIHIGYTCLETKVLAGDKK